MAISKNLKILIVEDDQFLSKMYPTKMEIEGFETDIALNGKEALEKYSTFKPDLILLDLMLPVMNGFEFMEVLKKKKNKTPIVIISNLGQDVDIQKAMDLGAVGYFVKANTELNDLVRNIEFVLKKKKR